MQVEEQNMTLCFATPIWRFEFSGYESVNADILAQLDAIGWGALDAKQRRIVHPSHTFAEDRFVTVEEVPALQIVLDYFVKCCNAIARERNWDTREQDVSLQSYWVHATPPGEVTQFHDHKPSLLSGVYYADKPEHSGDIMFMDINPYLEFGPRTLPGKTDPVAVAQITMPAAAGTMLVFPGWLPHRVPRNDSDRRRISISFNAI